MGGSEPEGPVSWGDLVDQVADYAIFRLDRDGTVCSWNRGAELVTGYATAEALGQSLFVFYPASARRSGLPLDLLEEARENGRAAHRGWQVRKDGSRFWGDTVVTALHDDGGHLTGFLKVTRDHSEQHELEVRLRESEERFRLLVSQVVDYAIIALDPQGTVRTWNRGAERVKGYTADEAVGRSFTMFYTDEDRRAGLPERLLARARKMGHVEHTGWRVRKDGNRFWADVTITALTDDRGQLTGYAKVIRDLTERKALEDARKAFYAAFDHDFRSPITALKGFVDALREAPEPTRDSLIDRVESSADRLLEMVTGLVEFATQGAALPHLRLEEIDVAQLARTVVRDLSPALEPGRVRVPDVVAPAWADRDAMHRVLANLVTNALKYSAPGTRVTVSFEPRADRLRLTVTDRGRGIRHDDVDAIFDEFVRGELAEDDGGTGLGLSSVRELVAQQGGTVFLESEEGVGTSVTVELPTRPVIDPTAAAQPLPSTSAPSRGHRSG